MQEIWRDIQGYEGLYQVSNLGRVKSLKRKTINNRCFKERILKTGLETVGYYSVVLCKEKQKTKTIHRLVAETFIPNPNNYPCVNHKNGIKTDNRIENLEWCTYRENTKHAIDVIQTNKGPVGNKNHCKQISQYDLQHNFIRKWDSLTSASKYLNITPSAISQCLNNKNETAGGYIWKYGGNINGKENA